MYLHDPIRQKMLFKTEWCSEGASGSSPEYLAEDLNRAFKKLLETGFSIVNMLPAKDGFIVVGRRVSTPLPEATPGASVPGTSATTDVEIKYSFIDNGIAKSEKMPSLREATLRAWADMSSASVQPVGIYVHSLTTYGPGDFHALHEKMLR